MIRVAGMYISYIVTLALNIAFGEGHSRPLNEVSKTWKTVMCHLVSRILGTCFWEGGGGRGARDACYFIFPYRQTC